MSYPYVEDLIAHWTGWSTGTQLLPTFGLLVASGVFIGLSMARRRLRVLPNPPLSESQLESICFAAVIAGLVGAKLLHAVEFLDAGFTEQFFSRQGYSIYGGLIVGLGVAVGMLYHKGLPRLATLDLVAPALLVGYAVGRLGCQISGDGDWGQQANLALKPDWVPTWMWAQTYTNNIAGVVISDPGVYPTPLYETVMALLGFGIVQWVWRGGAQYPGQTFASYFLVTGLARFAVEHIRINPRYGSLDWSQAQWVSMALICVALVWLLANWNRIRRAKVRPPF